MWLVSQGDSLVTRAARCWLLPILRTHRSHSFQTHGTSNRALVSAGGCKQWAKCAALLMPWEGFGIIYWVLDEKLMTLKKQMKAFKNKMGVRGQGSAAKPELPVMLISCCWPSSLHTHVECIALKQWEESHSHCVYCMLLRGFSNGSSRSPKTHKNTNKSRRAYRTAAETHTQICFYFLFFLS